MVPERDTKTPLQFLIKCLGVLQTLRSAKKTLWARPCLSVVFFPETTQPA
jgi:hypothetical protein